MLLFEYLIWSAVWEHANAVLELGGATNKDMLVGF